jgi:hypothetical protein
VLRQPRAAAREDAGLLENRVHRVTRQFVGEPAYSLLAELVLQSRMAMERAFTSEEWVASHEDLQSWGDRERVTVSSAEPRRPATAAGRD